MGSFTSDKETTYTINLGFKPDYLIVYYLYSSSDSVSCIYDSDRSTTTYIRYGASLSVPKIPNTNSGGKIILQSINDDGFTIFANKGLKIVYFAMKK